jgi:transposase-like protein
VIREMIVTEEVTMDRLLRRFRREAKKRPNQMYPEELRRLAVRYADRRTTEDVAVADIAAELGVAEQSLRTWMQKTGSDFRRVRVTDADEPKPQSETGKLVLISPSGYRLEGLDVASAFQMLRALR